MARRVLAQRLLLVVTTAALFMCAAWGCGDEPEEGDPCSGTAEKCQKSGKGYLSCGSDRKWHRVTDPSCTCVDGKEACQ